MLWWIFQNVVVTAALALVVWAIARAGRIGPVARHALWVIVLVKFVTPPVIVWPWGVPDPLGIGVESTSITTSTGSTTSTTGRTSTANAETVAGSASSVSSETPTNSRAFHGEATSRVSVGSWLAGVWIAGSAAMLLIEFLRLLPLARRVRRAEPADPAIVARVGALASSLRVDPPRVVVVTDQASPAIWGAGRPVLLWPAELPIDLTDACIDGLIVHELAHVKRGDHVVGWIELVAGVVWWWNPLFWYVRGAVREQAELACDAWVISALPNGRRAYAESLLAVSGALLRPSPSMAVIGMRATSRRVLERRLVMIMKGRTPLCLPSAGVLSLVLMAGATLPAFATSPQTPPAPPPPAAPIAVPATAAPTPTATTPPTMPAPMAPPATPEAFPMFLPSAPLPASAPFATAAPPVATTWPAEVTTPEPPQTPPARSVKVAPRPPAQVTPPRARIQREQLGRVLLARDGSSLPADGQQLAQTFENDRDAIQKDADQKIATRQAALVKSLQDLQDKYTKAGKLDEAVAIRDYLRTLDSANRAFIRKR